MRYTLLQLVQNVLSSMDSDEVNSISDTAESTQVVAIIKTAYDDLISRGDLVKHKTLFNLDASGDASKPVLMTKPDSVDNIEWLKYNRVLTGETDPEWGELQYMPLDAFMHMSQEYTPSETEVDTMTHVVSAFSITFNFRNDRGPQFYTTFDDNTIVFDSYDSVVDTTLQSSKTLGYGSRTMLFTETDSFVPELQPHQFALLLNEAKSLAWSELKQTPHLKAEQAARRNWVHAGKTRHNIPTGSYGSGAHPFDKLPNFGRK